MNQGKFIRSELTNHLLRTTGYHAKLLQTGSVQFEEIKSAHSI